MELLGAGILSSSAIGPEPRASRKSWKGSNITFAVVSKCPDDRTGANEGQVNRRTGDPRKLYFSLDLKLFKLLEQGPELLDQDPETSFKVSRRPDGPERPSG